MIKVLLRSAVAVINDMFGSEVGPGTEAEGC